MSIEELLKPRYKIINPFPGDHGFEINSIIEYREYTVHDEDFTPDMYPNLFRKLEWYEERKIEDMPEYVKCYFGICKVKKHFQSRFDRLIIIDQQGYDRELYYNNLQMYPSDETEYTQYINQQSKP